MLQAMHTATVSETPRPPEVSLHQDKNDNNRNNAQSCFFATRPPRPLQAANGHQEETHKQHSSRIKRDLTPEGHPDPHTKILLYAPVRCERADDIKRRSRDETVNRADVVVLTRDEIELSGPLSPCGAMLFNLIFWFLPLTTRRDITRLL